jgi:hypothetical protein
MEQKYLEFYYILSRIKANDISLEDTFTSFMTLRARV